MPTLISHSPQELTVLYGQLSASVGWATCCPRVTDERFQAA